MNRTTVDFGIDLGTTNSAIALLTGVSTEIIKNDRDQDVTPSAVSFGKAGRLFVGNSALSNLLEKPEDAHVEFKRNMGTDFTYAFKSSGLSKRPEELSAEVLKSLRGDVVTKLGEEIHSAVITIPAAFELHQCNATRQAAEMAGLKGSFLLQEPVAAALAHGFQVDSERAYWLVYDFGGGTFDAALIKAEEGLINVVHHGGDNFLGGANVDWAILEKIVVPKLRENYDLPEFTRGSERWKRPLAKLKRAIELAKIELTTRRETNIIGCVFEDASGETVDCEDVVLTQAEVIRTAEPYIRKSTDICRKVLAERNLSAADVQKVILVGGPTKAPYFREMLKENLGIAIDSTVDPLTVVARGAAVFAGTQKLDRKLARPAAAGECQVEMLKSYKTVGHELDPLAGGRVLDPSGASVAGYTIEFVNRKTQWRSGKIALNANGDFMVNILAEKGDRNTFLIELCDAQGGRRQTVPDHLVYTVGAVVEEMLLTHSIGVALANNEVEWIFKKGEGLPMKRKSPERFFTVRGMKVGEAGVAIRVPVVEGENQVADRNCHVGSLEITSSNIKRDLASGTEVELALKINESRDIEVFAYIPTLDEEFEIALNLGRPTIGNASVEFPEELRRLDLLAAQAEGARDSAAVRRVAEIRQLALVGEIRDCLAAAKGDAAAAQEAEKRLLELKLHLDDVEDAIKWPAMVAKIREWLDDLDRLVKEHGSDEQLARANELARESEKIITGNARDRLPAMQRQVEELYYRILFAIPSFWVGQFQRLSRERDRMSDLPEAERLVEMGRNYLQQDNIDGLRNVVRRLWELLPREVAEQVQRGFGAGLMR